MHLPQSLNSSTFKAHSKLFASHQALLNLFIGNFSTLCSWSWNFYIYQLRRPLNHTFHLTELHLLKHFHTFATLFNYEKVETNKCMSIANKLPSELHTDLQRSTNLLHTAQTPHASLFPVSCPRASGKDQQHSALRCSFSYSNALMPSQSTFPTI